MSESDAGSGGNKPASTIVIQTVKPVTPRDADV